MKNNGFLSGALILSIGGVLAKIFSAIYRIGLTRILGAEGIGVYQLVFPLYSLCVVIATAGIPMAISKVIAKNQGRHKSVIKKCMLFSSIISIVLCLILILFSRGLAKLQGDETIWICYVILAPTIIIVAVCSILRGYFQGVKNFTPSAVSNIAEQFVKLVLGLILSLVLLKISLIASIIGAMISIAVSEIVALVILVCFIRKNKGGSIDDKDVPLKEILKDVLPITFTNAIMPIACFVDSLIVVNLLSIHFTKQQSIFLYGLESGAVGSLSNIPTIFSFALASVILPSITGKGKQSRDFNLQITTKIVLVLTLPCVVLFMATPSLLLNILYSGKLNGQGFNGLNIASGLLSITGIGILFLAINQVLSSSLQAIDRRRITVKNLSIAVVIKFVVEIVLMPIKEINIFALSIATTLCYLLVFILNYFEIKKHFNLGINNTFLYKLLLSNLIMLIAVWGTFSLTSGMFGILLSLLIGGLVYVISLVMLNPLTKKEKALMKYKLK